MAEVSVLILRYVPLSQAGAYLRLGWLPSDALNGTYHGAHAVLMEWLCDCEAKEPR